MNNNDEKMGYAELGKEIAKERFRKMKAGIKIKYQEHKEQKYMEKAAYRQAFQEEKEKSLIELAKRRAGKYKYTPAERMLGSIKPSPRIRTKPVQRKVQKPMKKKYQQRRQTGFEMGFSQPLPFERKKRSDIDLMLGRLR